MIAARLSFTFALDTLALDTFGVTEELVEVTENRGRDWVSLRQWAWASLDMSLSSTGLSCVPGGMGGSLKHIPRLKRVRTVNSCTVVCSGCGRKKWVCHWHWGKRKAASNHWKQREVASDFSFECTSTLGDHLIPSCSWFSSDISCSARKASSLAIVVVDSLQPQLLFLLPI